MINVDGQNIVLGGTDGVLLKELSYLIGVLHTRIVSRGVHSSNAVNARHLSRGRDMCNRTGGDDRVDVVEGEGR